MHRNLPHRRGSVFITTLWIITALAGLALVLGQTVRVEAIASANRLAQAQADTAERGAEQFVQSAVDEEVATPGSVTSSTSTVSMEAQPLGSCYFWVLRPDPDDETATAFGLTDEASKLDINAATSAMLLNLPNMTEDVSDPILDWRSPAAAPRSEGAEDSYYMGLPTPYHCKNAPFETVEELMLVKDVTADLLWGSDTARSGHVDSQTATTGSSSSSLSIGASTSDRGIFPFITIYGVKASTSPKASSTASSTTTAAPVNVNNVTTQNSTAFITMVQTYGAGVNASQLARATEQFGPYSNIFDWAAKVNLTSANFSKMFHHVTTGNTATTARINLNSASANVLLCLPGLTQTDADAIVAHRTSNPNPVDPTDISWLLDVISKNKLAAIGNYIGGSSHCFSADILAVSGDGRAFKRCRIVVDASVSPSRIIYRRDMTSYGWPLSADIRTQLRNGTYVAPATTSGTGAM